MYSREITTPKLSAIIPVRWSRLVHSIFGVITFFHILCYDIIMVIDLYSFQQAINRLREALERHEEEPEDLFVQDSVVQRFEYTYELAYKTLKRFLEATAASAAEIDAMSFQNLIRTGNESGLLKSSAATWLDYRDKRNMTSHTYDNAKALEVIAVAPLFLEESEYLLSELERRNGK